MLGNIRVIAFIYTCYAPCRYLHAAQQVRPHSVYRRCGCALTRHSRERLAQANDRGHSRHIHIHKVLSSKNVSLVPKGLRVAATFWADAAYAQQRPHEPTNQEVVKTHTPTPSGGEQPVTNTLNKPRKLPVVPNTNTPRK